MSREKQNEIYELAKQMSEAISTEVEQKYIMEEAKLEAVLRENGWVKAEKIFEEIEACLAKSGALPEMVGIVDFVKFAELKKKYTEGER